MGVLRDQGSWVLLCRSGVQTGKKKRKSKRKGRPQETGEGNVLRNDGGEPGRKALLSVAGVLVIATIRETSDGDLMPH